MMPRATAMISMFMQGGPSHLDLCDRKLELEKRHLQNFAGEIKYDNAAESSAKLWAGPGNGSGMASAAWNSVTLYRTWDRSLMTLR